MVPCPGATMLLLFALYAGLPLLGAAGVIAMSLGMGVVISSAGYLAWFGREGLFSRLKSNERTIGIAADLLEMLSYTMVLGFSLYMAWPVMAALVH
jgi:ABC-type nickel/cobalt efflux system permease component RcnA